MTSASNPSLNLARRLRQRANFVGGVLGPLVALGGVIGIFAVADLALSESPKFLSPLNMQSIAVAIAYIVIAALGMTLIVVAGGIDLSVGSAVVLSAIVLGWGLREDVAFFVGNWTNFPRASAAYEAAQSSHTAAKKKIDPKLLAYWGEQLNLRRSQIQEILESKKTRESAKLFSVMQQQLSDPTFQLRVTADWLKQVPNSPATPFLAVILCIGTGVLCGLVNGLIIVGLRVVPFIATLSTMTIYLGIAKQVAGETSVRPGPWQVPEWITNVSTRQPVPAWLGVSQSVWLALLLAGATALVLRYTIFGRYVFAVGSSETTARLCGINVPLVKVAVYTLAGFFSGVAGLCLFAKLSSGTPTSTGLELQVIAAVVIGGASLSGGRGSVLGTVTGAAIMGLVNSGGTQLGLPNPLQDILLGVIILAAVTVDQLRQRRE